MKKLLYAIIIVIGHCLLSSVSMCASLLSGIVVEEGKDGIVVIEVENNISAVKAGVEKDDIIEEIDGEEINNLESYLKKIEKIDESVNLRIRRGDSIFDLTIKSHNISVDIPLNEGDMSFVNDTPITKADIFCKDGLIFMSEGLKEEALDSFKMAADLYEQALHNEYMPKEELVEIRENLKRMSEQLDGSTVKSAEIKDGLTSSPISPARFSTDKDSGTTTTAIQLPTADQLEPTPAPELTPAPFVNKSDIKKAETGEYWIIESTTILLKSPELHGNGSRLLGNLIGGISSGTTVAILETKGSGDVNRWVKVEVYNKKNEIYANGWILTDTVGNARQIENRRN